MMTEGQLSKEALRAMRTVIHSLLGQSTGVVAVRQDPQDGIHSAIIVLKLGQADLDQMIEMVACLGASMATRNGSYQPQPQLGLGAN